MRRSLFLVLVSAALTAAACAPAPVGDTDGALQGASEGEQDSPAPGNAPETNDSDDDGEPAGHDGPAEAPEGSLGDDQERPGQEERPSNEENLDEADPSPVDENPADENPVDETPVDREPGLDEPEAETPGDEQAPVDEEPVEPVSDGMARFRLSLIDAPVDEAEGIYITVQAVRVQFFGDYEAPVDEEPVEEEEAPVDEEPVEEEEAPVDEEPSDEEPSDEEPSDEEPVEEEEGGRPDSPGNQGNRGGQGNNEGEEEEDGGTWITLDVEPARYNLLELTNNVQAMLTEQELPVGSYGGVRLLLGCEGEDAPTIELEGAEHPLTIPSGCQSGVKMPVEFDLAEGVEVSFVMDFDVRRSVHKTGNGRYIMRPVVRLLAEAQIGEISGTVPAESGWTAFAFAPGSYDADSNAPFDSALNSAIPTESGFFSITALPVGVYDVVIGDLDERHFFPNVEVTAGGVMDLGDIDFEAPPVDDELINDSDEEPSDEAPVDEEPVDEAPVDEEPSDEAPVDEEPSDEAPVDEEPSDEEPVDEEPVDEEPVDEAPVDEEPSDEEPVDEAPSDEEPNP